MNFLSHYYFDKYSRNPDRVIGTVLPDLVKNANRRWSLHPHKYEMILLKNEQSMHIFGGWLRHLEVDRHFHSSDFFTAHTRNIRDLIAPVLAGGNVRPSFLAHVALELMLDGLLITENRIDPHQFYQHLKEASGTGLDHFLKASGLEDTTGFFGFLEKFIEAGYLHSYSETPNIMYALDRICRRLWNDPLSAIEQHQLTDILLAYRNTLEMDFMDIFDEISLKLNASL